MQAKAGMAGELSPYTTAATPAHPAQGQPRGTGPGRIPEAEEMALGRDSLA